MKLTVIGECSGAPAPGGATASLLVEEGSSSLVLDLGSGTLSRLMQARDFDKIDTIFLSHPHADHTADAGVATHSRLISTQLGREVEPLEFLSLSDWGFTLSPYSFHTPVSPGISVERGPFRLSFLETRHTSPCLAVKVEAGGKSLVYTADGEATEELAAFASACDILVSECTFHPGLPEPKPGHMRPEDTVALARAARPKLLIATHLPVYGDRNGIKKYLEENWEGEAELARPGLEVEA